MFETMTVFVETLCHDVSMSDIVNVFVAASPVTVIVPTPTTLITPDPFGPISPPVFPSRKRTAPGKAVTESGPAWLIDPPYAPYKQTT